MKNTLLAFSLLLTSFYTANSQCVTDIKTFKPGEKITYKAYYNWGLVWLEAGEVEFSVGQTSYLNKKVYHFETSGKSLPNYDKLYKVRDRFQSNVEIENFAPMWAERNTSEGGFTAHESYTFVPGGRKVFGAVENSDKAYKRDTLYTVPCTFDLLSAVFYCRTIDFEKYSKTEKIPVRVVVDNKQYPLYLRYLGKETIQPHNDKRKFRCIKFAAMMIDGTIFKAGESMTIWITDDVNRIPVQVQAKIIIGSVKGIINTMEGLANESTAIVK